ncbi:MAG: UrcA family protein [Pseudomonadota bacterium]
MTHTNETLSRRTLSSSYVSTLFIAIAAVLALSSNPALAGSGQDLKLKFSSDQLRSDAAALELYAVIENQIQHFCEDNGTKTLIEKRAEKRCTAEMLDKAIRKIANNRLSAIHLKSANKEYVAP